MERPALADESPLYRYRFGTAEFDEARRALWVGGLLVELEQKPQQVLACLLRHSDAVVKPQELFEGRKSVGMGQSGSIRADLGGRRIFTQNTDVHHKVKS